MTILPQQLKGKIIADCYESDRQELTLVFTDGTKTTLYFQGYIHYPKQGTKEPDISLHNFY